MICPSPRRDHSGGERDRYTQRTFWTYVNRRFPLSSAKEAKAVFLAATPLRRRADRGDRDDVDELHERRRVYVRQETRRFHGPLAKAETGRNGAERRERSDRRGDRAASPPCPERGGGRERWVREDGTAAGGMADGRKREAVPSSGWREVTAALHATTGRTHL